MLPPSTKRKLRDIHHEITLLITEMCGMSARGEPVSSAKVIDLMERLDTQNKRIYGILDPPYRRSSK